MQNLEYAKLLDAYAPLLTDNQKEIGRMHFSFDLTLSEIAEEKGVSHQSVSECITKTKKQLEGYETELGLLSEREKARAVFEKVFSFAETLSQDEEQTLKGILNGVI